eukprot:1156674-Pelagomonas_calceolata.AAC.7
MALQREEQRCIWTKGRLITCTFAVSFHTLHFFLRKVWNGWRIVIGTANLTFDCAARAMALGRAQDKQGLPHNVTTRIP